MFCKNCGANINDGELFCPECGTKQDVVQQEVAQPEVQQYNPQPAADVTAPEGVAAVKAGGDKKKFAIIGIAAVIVVAVLALIFAFAGKGGSKELDFALFRKDGNLYINYFKDNTSMKLSSKGGSDAVYCEANGYLFFLDNYDDGGYTLRYFDTTVKKAEDRSVEKLVSGVEDYIVSKDGKTVYYETDEGVIYAHNYEEKTKIAKDAEVLFDAEYNIVAYLEEKEDDDGEETAILYSINKKYEKTELLKDIEDYDIFENEDGSQKAVVYAKNIIYVYNNGKLEKIKENFSVDEDESFNILSIDDKNNFYYTFSKGGTEADAEDYVTDSKKDSDANIVKPDDDDVKYWVDPNVTWWWDVELNEQYYKDLKAFREKELRDDLREALEEGVEISGITDRKIYYFNGKDDVELVANVTDYDVLSDTVIAYEKVDLAAEVSVDIDDIAKSIIKEAEADGDEFNEYTYYWGSSWDIIDYVKEQLIVGYTKGVLVDNTQCTVSSIVNADADEEDMDNFDYLSFRLDEKESAVYYRADRDEDTGAATLYKMDIKSKSLGEAKEVYKDVQYYWFDDDNNIYTTRDPDTEEDVATLYINDKKISDDVSTEAARKLLDSGEYLFGTDYSEKHDTFRLNMYDGKNTVAIADDVYSYLAINANKILFINDFDDDDYEGTLNLWTGAKKEIIEVEDGVSGVFLPSVIEKK